MNYVQVVLFQRIYRGLPQDCEGMPRGRKQSRDQVAGAYRVENPLGEFSTLPRGAHAGDHREEAAQENVVGDG